jgi:uncharacterized protein YbjT (DUF2867 family)
VLPRLVKDGHDVRPMSRRRRPGWAAADLETGEGLAEAVRGVDAIVHLASSPTKTRKTDVEGTRRLVAAAAARVRHVLYISIIGIDRVALPYYKRKLEAEAVIRASGLPFTILRAAQFPSLIDTVLSYSSKAGPLLIDKNLLFQPTAIEDVADRVADLLAGAPTGGIVEFAGPYSARLDVLARDWLRARGSKRPVWPVRIPGRSGREVRAGALTTSAEPRGARTWQDYLAAKY